MMRTTVLAAALASFIMSACASGERRPFVPNPAPPDRAALYFYRRSEMTARLQKPTITLNAEKAGRLANDSYGVAFVRPGAVDVRSRWPGVPGSTRDDSLTLNAEAGKRYFLRVRYQTRKPRGLTPSVPGVGGIQFEDRVGLEQVDEAQAVPQMAGMTMTDSFPPPSPDK